MSSGGKFTWWFNFLQLRLQTAFLRTKGVLENQTHAMMSHSQQRWVINGDLSLKTVAAHLSSATKMT